MTGLQKPTDEQPASSDHLNISAMTREERDELKRKLVAANPEAARQLGLTIAR